MERLRLFLLGAFEAKRGTEPITNFESDKVRALLAYLVMEAGQPHRREKLADLLWLGLPERAARQNLSQALFNLREAIGDRQADPPFLSITPQTIEFNRASEHWLDVTVLDNILGACAEHRHNRRVACAICLKQYEEAASLYQGEFLEGFTLIGCQAFNEWVLMERERFHRQVCALLSDLVEGYRLRGQIAAMLKHARRWVALDPWNESANRALMLALSLDGQRGAAIQAYETCYQILRDEIGVSPGPETTKLYEQIQVGELRPLEIQTEHFPAFLEADVPKFGYPVFVSRQREMRQLDAALGKAVAGEGGVIFITGDPGQGKTALMDAFVRRAVDKAPEVLLLRGSCNAYIGIGDPYLPFRQVLSELTADVEHGWLSGRVPHQLALRLWDALPLVAWTLLDYGADLLDVFLLQADFLERARAVLPGDEDLAKRFNMLKKEETDVPGGSTQADLLAQYTEVLGRVSEHHTLVLLLDDLQWMDSGSIDLLFHLGRQVAGERILIVGAYRPEEIALGRRDGRHPLEMPLAEFKRQYGDVWIDLAEVDRESGRVFVDLFLDSEPNRLSAAFRQKLYRRTGGHVLFTIELIRNLQENGDLFKDKNGSWMQKPELDWEALPARIEGVIEARIQRLEKTLRETLTIASVEGEDFTAQVVAVVQELNERKLLHKLSTELEVRHQLVRAQGEDKIGTQTLSQYRFTHALFQSFLYNEICARERCLLHKEIADVLEHLYGEKVDRISPQLAYHFGLAEEAEKAIHYSLLAGDQARFIYAHREAINHYERALVFQEELGDYDGAARTQMKMGLAHHSAYNYEQANQSFEAGFTLWQRSVENRDSRQVPPAPHALRVGIHSEPETIDPILAIDHTSGVLLSCLFSGLVEYSPDLDVVPALADRWELMEGGCKYIFHLRQDATWSDGVRVTAADFLYSWRLILNPDFGSLNAGLFYDIKGARAFHQGEINDEGCLGIRALDPFTLEIELEAPTSYFLQLMAHMVPVPTHVVVKYGKDWATPEHLVGNGPFVLDHWERGESISLKRNRGYYGRLSGNVQYIGIIFQSGKEPITNMAIYQANELDVLDLTFYTQGINRLRRQHRGEYISIPNFGTYFMMFNRTKPPFDDIRVRKAFMKALNIENRTTLVSRGLALPALGGFIPPGMVGHSPGIGLSYDPARALELLGQAGYPDGQNFPTVTVLIYDSLGFRAKDTLRQFQENLGIKFTWEFVTATQFAQKVKQYSPHITVSGWLADYPDPDNYLRVCLGIDAKLMGWDEEDFDRKVENIRHIMDHGERIKRYKEIDTLLIQEAILLPLSHTMTHLLVKPWVKNYPISPLGHVFWKDVVIEAH
jgi:ABC-type oligopeptide transport system substrate-binding subunit/DNA-binding SARP family transcriptional activator